MTRSAFPLIFAFLFYLTANATVHFKTRMPNLDNVNNIEIHFFKGKPSTYKTNRPIDLNYLKELITKAKNVPALQFDTTGEIIYFQDKTPILKAYFCSRGSGSKYKSTGAVMFRIGPTPIKALLNYGSGMLINEEFYQLNKKN